MRHKLPIRLQVKKMDKRKKVKPTSAINGLDSNSNSNVAPVEVDFSSSESIEKPIVGIARVQEMSNQSLEEKNEDLSSKIKKLEDELEIFLGNGAVVIKVTPDQIDPESLFYNRSPGFFSTQDYLKVRNGIEFVGHLIQPVVLRPHPDEESGFKYQKVTGDTRIHCCIDLNMDIDAVIRSYTDREVASLMFSENKDRNDRADLEQGRTFQDLKDRKIFKTQVEIAKNCRVSEGTVSDCLKMLTIPLEIVTAFDNESFLTTHNTRSLIRSLKILENRYALEKNAQYVFDLGLENSELLKLFSEIELLRRFVKFKTHDDIPASQRLSELILCIEEEALQSQIQEAELARDKVTQDKKEKDDHEKRLAKLDKGPLPQNSRRDITVRGKKLGDLVNGKSIALKFGKEQEQLAK